MDKNVIFALGKTIGLVCTLASLFGCSTTTIIEPSLYFSVEDTFERGHLPGETLDGIPNVVHTEVTRGETSSTVFGLGVISRKLRWSNKKAIAEINISPLFKSLEFQSAMLTVFLTPNNAIDPAYREFDIYLFEGNGLIDYDDFSIPGVKIGTYNFTVPERKHIQIEVFDYVQQLLRRKIVYLGIRIEPIGENPPSSTIVKHLQIN